MGITSTGPASGPALTLIRAEDLTVMQAMAARIACERMTGPAMKRLLDSVARASSLPTRPGLSAT
jgi:hypothetical protein